MILITGANGVVGYALQQTLSSDQFLSVSRNQDQGDIQWDLRRPMPAVQGLSTLIHCAPIWLLPPHLEALKSTGVKQLIVFSSSSVIAKRRSQEPKEQALVEQLQNAEKQIVLYCQQHQLALTILRPSLIYGYGRDQNISHIARFIQRWGFAVVVAKASGLRQPVHADDLAQACLSILSRADSVTDSESTIFTVAGGEQLSYREMVKRIFSGLNRQPKIIGVPVFALRLALKTASWLGRFDYTASMADRMQQDLVYDNSAAQAAFGFKPQLFLQHPEQDLPANES